MKKVFVVVPVHNRIEDTKEFIKSINKQSYKNFETIIIDDGSSDGTSEYLKKNHPHVTVLYGDGNLFYTGGMRKGINYVMKKAKKGDFVLTLNNDTAFEKDYIKKLVEISENNNRLVLGTICKEKGTGRIIDTNHKTNWNVFSFKSKKRAKPTRDIIYDTDTLSGRGVLVPIEVFHKIGNYNKNLPQCGSDSDLFLRAKKAGFNLGISTKVVTYSLDDGKGMDEHIREKKNKTLKDMYKLFFSIRSKYNIVNKTKMYWYHAPALKKIPLILKWYAYFLFNIFVVYPLGKLNIHIKV